MPLTVSFQLSDRDLKYFADRMNEAKSKAASRDNNEILEAAGKLVAELRKSDAPDFVRDRVEKLDLLTRMLEDVEWKLQGEDQARVRNAMAYVVDPHDLIPDQIPGLGFLDDAIMVELVCRELRHEIDAYQDFCKFRDEEEKRRGKSVDPLTREQWLSTRRAQLHERMRRRRAALWDARLGRSLL
jgi:uncharacterized membrane protein YkvA (DUF1232 family)